MGSPTWHDVAKKYRSDHEEAMHHLQHKIAHGGSGAWGKMDMPPYPDLSEADIRILARGILASNAGNSISNSKGK
jgi:cytochrome c